MTKKKISSDSIIAIMATIVSCCALFVSGYQTYLQRQQQDASVWPYLQLDISSVDDDAEKKYQIYLTLKNKGIGPAIIESCEINSKNKKISNFSDLFGFLSTKKYEGNFGYNDIYPKRIIAQSEEINVGGAEGKDYKKEIYDIILDTEFSIKIRYSSVFGKKWELLWVPELNKTKTTEIE